MTRQRSLEEIAERREAQRDGREQRRTGRLPVPEAAAGMAALVPRNTRHPGSKPWFSHRPAAAADNQLAQAAVWSQLTGRPLPPQARIRTTKVSNAVPLGTRDRQDRYARANSTETLTPRQRKRARRKTGMRLAGLRIGSREHQELADAYLALRPDGTAG